MRKLMIIGAAVAALSVASPAAAQDRGAIVGGTAGAWTGGTIGFLVGGPIGAVIGGWTGAAIGASVLSEDVQFGPGPDLMLDAEYYVGDLVGPEVRLRGITGDPRYGYFRAHGQVYVVDMHTRTVVEIRFG